MHASFFLSYRRKSYVYRWDCWDWANIMVDFLRFLEKISLSFFLILIIFSSTSCKEHRKDKRLSYPYFASLKTSKINARCGPGVSYPIEWVYIKPHTPVEVLEEFEHWRKIRDIHGDEAWVNKTMISKKRTAIVTAEKLPLFEDANEKSPLVANLAKDVQLDLKKCTMGWCQIKIEELKGYVQTLGLFGVGDQETF